MKSLFSLLAVTAAFSPLLSPALAAVTVSPTKEGDRCQFPDGTVGRCEKMASCLEDNGVVKRSGEIVLCSGGNPMDFVSCCRRPFSVAKEMCLVWAKYWLKKTPDRSQTCTSTTPLIGGGEEAGLGEFPNMAALGNSVRNKRKPEWNCGGSLITPSFVLTAAHCVVHISRLNPDLMVGLGEHDLVHPEGGDNRPRLDEGMPEGLASAAEPGDPGASSPVEQLIEVAEVFIYPDYYQQRYHDIALLRLKRPAVLTNRVLPACLPTQGPDRYTSESNFTAIGWGNSRFGWPLLSETGSKNLQKVEISYIGAVKCGRQILETNRQAYPILGITEEMFCAGGPMKDTCKGDSGGPLMQKAELPSDAGPCQPEMVGGVVSFGPYECGSLGVYTRVSTYIDWITGIVAPQLLPANA